jgi:hypothetical protein
VQSNDSYHYFNEDFEAHATIPYTGRTFIAPWYDVKAQTPRELHIEFWGIHGEFTFEVLTALGDDFHVGVMQGLQSNFTYEEAHPKVHAMKVNYRQPSPRAEEKPHAVPFQKALRQFKKQEHLETWPQDGFVSFPTVPESGILSTIKEVVDTTVPIAEGVSALAGALDATMVTEQPLPLFPRPMQYTIATDTVTFKETLKTTNHNGLSLPDKQAFMADGNEANVHNIMCNTKQLSHRIEWKASEPAGKLIATLGVGPAPVNSHSTDGQIHDEIFHLYDYWSGSQRFIFDIACTPMHTGQLTIAYAPLGSAGSLPGSLEEATQTYFTTYDLSSGGGTLSVTAPYLSNYQYAEVPPIDGVSDYQYPGQLLVYVSNPLRATTVVAPEVEILVYTAWHDDLRLGVYGNNSLIRRRL